jgi:hypothetical protein
MNRELQELATEIAVLSDKLSGLHDGSKMYTAPMAAELSKHEHFICLAFQSLMAYHYPNKSIDKICSVAIEAGTELARQLNYIE